VVVEPKVARPQRCDVFKPVRSHQLRPPRVFPPAGAYPASRLDMQFLKLPPNPAGRLVKIAHYSA
jgi:hypothetical protein